MHKLIIALTLERLPLGDGERAERRAGADR